MSYSSLQSSNVTISNHKLKVGNLDIEVVLKPIRNIHLAVLPPAGAIRISAPHGVTDEALRLYIISRHGWIKQHMRRFVEQERESARLYIPNETHWYLGRCLLLKVHSQVRRNVVHFGHTHLTVSLHSQSHSGRIKWLIDEAYRKSLREIATELVAKWEKRIGVRSKELRIQRMKTQWGSCSPSKGNIVLNLELAKKPVECIEYVIVHELMHLIDHKHGLTFQALMDNHYPNWRVRREQLNRLPIHMDV